MSKYDYSLVSDQRLLTLGVKYQKADLGPPITSLDSILFGANVTSTKPCAICKNNIDKCPSHAANIELPIPIINELAEEKCRYLLPCLCPICSSLLVPEETLAQIRKLNKQFRFKQVVKAAAKYKDGFTHGMIRCPHQNELHPDVEITSAIEFDPKPYYEFCPYFMIKNPKTADFELLNPLYAMQVLQNFHQMEEIGLSDSNHPKNFMTNLVHVIPAKLRAKSLVNGEETASALTTYYTLIIDDAIPELMNVKNYCINKNIILIDSSTKDTFVKAYGRLVGYTKLILNVGSEKTANQLNSIINKGSFKAGYDASNCMINKFKGKNKSIFNKGMLGFTHDVSGRVVLGPGEDIAMQDLIVPLTMANKLITLYPVYKENLLFVKILITKMSNTEIWSNQFIPKVLGIQSKRKGRFEWLTQANVQSMAAQIEPGDKIGITLCDHDFIIQNRHPSIREECLTSFQVTKYISSTVGIPLAPCGIKQADFDGDEIQVYLCSGHATDVEALLLHSVYTQLRSASDGGLSFYFDGAHDDDLGVSRINDIEIGYYNHQKIPYTNVLTLMEEVLPKGLNYESKSLVIRDGKIDKKLCSFKNKEFYKYIAARYGDDICCHIIDRAQQVGYDINRFYGATLGFEIRFWCSDQQRKELMEMKEEARKKAIGILKAKGRADETVPDCFTEKQALVKKILIESAAGQNFANNNYTANRPTEYIAMVYGPDFVHIDGAPVAPTLANGSRTNFGSYRASFDPDSYGHVEVGYAYDMNPYSHFFIVADELGAIYTRTTGVAKQGYMTNEMTVLMERAFADNNGAIVDGTHILSSQYGPCGLDSRAEVLLPMEDIDLKQSDFAAKHSDKKLVAVHKELYDLRRRYSTITAFVNNDVRNIFVTGIDFNQFFIKAEKGKTDQKVVDAFIQDMYNVFVPEALQDDITKLTQNFKSHEYFFRLKFEQYKLTHELAVEILTAIKGMLVQAGDPIGIKAALACSAPLTQAALSAIHKATSGGAGVDRVRRPTGMQAFSQLLVGAKPDDLVIITITLNDDSKEACDAFALEQETFFFHEIWCKNEIGCQTVIPEVLTNIYGKELLKEKRSPYYVNSIWNMVTISGYGIKTTDIIREIMSSYPIIKMILPRVINRTQLQATIYFHENTSLIEIYAMLNRWTKKDDEFNVIHGKYLKNCFVREVRSNPGHYIIEANESRVENGALQHLIYDPRVNPARCKTTHPQDSFSIFGVCEAKPRHFEQLVFTAENLASTKSLSCKNYNVITAVQTAAGTLTFAEALSMAKTHFGEFLKRVKFERADMFIREYLDRGEPETVNEFTSANVFSDLPKLGSSVSSYVWHAVQK